jgi:hypothetical protein
VEGGETVRPIDTTPENELRRPVADERMSCLIVKKPVEKSSPGDCEAVQPCAPVVAKAKVDEEVQQHVAAFESIYIWRPFGQM